MTIPKCLGYCQNHGLQYAGIFHGDQCYCGSGITYGLPGILNSFVSNALGQCTTLCFGDDSKGCGGPTSISVYINLAAVVKRDEEDTPMQIGHPDMVVRGDDAAPVEF